MIILILVKLNFQKLIFKKNLRIIYILSAQMPINIIESVARLNNLIIESMENGCF